MGSFACVLAAPKAGTMPLAEAAQLGLVGLFRQTCLLRPGSSWLSSLVALAAKTAFKEVLMEEGTEIGLVVLLAAAFLV